MRQKLQVQSSEPTGLPMATVPADCMWDLVEYLSCHRIAVTYHHSPTHFSVSFLRTDVPNAQRLLDQWSDSAAHLMA